MLIGASRGQDFSGTTPTVPTIGATAFGTTGTYANYTLVATVPFQPFRKYIEVGNLSGDQVVLIRDDGHAASGAPSNPSFIALGGGAAVGAQGGSWSSDTFLGRVRVFAPSASAFVAVFTD